MMDAACPQPSQPADGAGYHNITAQASGNYATIPLTELEQLERHYIAILTTLWRLQGKRRKIVVLK